MTKENYKVTIIGLIVIFVIGIGIIIDVYYQRYQKEKKQELEKYKIVKNIHKYSVNSTKLDNMKLKNIFVIKNYIFLHYTGNGGTLLRLDVENNKVKVLFENDNEKTSNVKRFGSYYVLNNKLYKTNGEELERDEIEGADFSKEYLSFNLKYKLIRTDKGILRVDFEKESSLNVLLDKDGYYYYPEEISFDSSYYLVNRTKEKNKLDKSDILIVRASDNKIINILEYKENITYDFLRANNILKTEIKDNYVKYSSLKLDKSVITETKKYKDCLHDDDRLLCKDKKDNLVLFNPTTEEFKKLLSKKELNKEGLIDNFIMSDDEYSLIIHFKDKNEFYLYYL